MEPDHPYMREIASASEDDADEWTKADLMDYYSRFPEAMDDW